MGGAEDHCAGVTSQWAQGTCKPKGSLRNIIEGQGAQISGTKKWLRPQEREKDEKKVELCCSLKGKKGLWRKRMPN